MDEEDEQGTGRAGADTGDEGLPRATTLFDVLTYRKVAIAVVSAYLGLEDDFIDAVLADLMDEFLAEQDDARAALKERDFPAYASLLAREAVTHYAATAAEGLAASPDSDLAQKRVMGDTGILGLTDDINAVIRVQEMFAPMTLPGFASESETDDEETEAEMVRLVALRQWCNYYNACAYSLVRGPLLPVIIDAVEACYRRPEHDPLTADFIRRLLAERGITGRDTDSRVE